MSDRMNNPSREETQSTVASNHIHGIEIKSEDEIDSLNIETTIPPPTHVFFAGASWGCGFYIGVYKSLQEKYGLETLSKCKFAGNSAGGLIALLAASGLDWTVAEKIYLICLNKAAELGVFQKMSIFHDISIDEVLLKDTEMYKKLNNKLFIGVCQFLEEFELISHWKSNQSLRDTIHASMHIPYYCTHINKIQTKKGWKRCIDGSFSTMFHRFNRTTLVVTAMSDKGDIYSEPRLEFWKDCYEPNLEKYYTMRDNGYAMMNKWNGKYKWGEYDMYTKSRYRLKKKRLFNVNMKKIIVFCCWIARIVEEIQIKRILFMIVCVLLYRKYGKAFFKK